MSVSESKRCEMGLDTRDWMSGDDPDTDSNPDTDGNRE